MAPVIYYTRGSALLHDRKVTQCLVSCYDVCCQGYHLCRVNGHLWQLIVVLVLLSNIVSSLSLSSCAKNEKVNIKTHPSQCSPHTDKLSFLFPHHMCLCSISCKSPSPWWGLPFNFRVGAEVAGAWARPRPICHAPIHLTRLGLWATLSNPSR